ncbi:OLC1v1031269C2 [Oldenlandia corymbosa var. corymbosa]|uniref:OLC1v1031269C2 n=1 Tax=Oldenlandia corymbosa var. corymbosa TaxID=529605 RepID=A0AAV1CI44_OLDCO|nr:OLC1v1031269C2 [Oldenlandia corymbosa var. corymbosa]
MAAIEAIFSIFSSCPSSASTSDRYPLQIRPSSSLKLPTSTPTFSFPVECSLCLLSPVLSKKTSFRIRSAVEEAVVPEEKTEPIDDKKRKLFVLNLPWSLTVEDIKTLFGECGSVSDVEIIKKQDGKNRGFAFVTMGSGEEARAVIEKFDSFEVSGRIIRVEFAKRFRKPTRSTPQGTAQAPSGQQTPHVLYASNLAWKVRSSHLREFFSANNPVSARVVFDSLSGKSAGYGFVSFASKEEAEAALASLAGKVITRVLNL